MEQREGGADRTTEKRSRRGSTLRNAAGSHRPLWLVVLDGGALEAYPLPERAVVRVGRSAGNDVRLDHPTVSRRHATVHVGSGRTLSVEDLGSANGTRVGKQRLEPRKRIAVAAGEVFEIGGLTVVISQRASSTPSHCAPAPPEQPFLVADTEMRRLHRVIEAVATSTMNVLITGETGTGKEVLARELHRLSSRARGPMVCVNCAALPETLLESELFGYEKGAFTGATAARVGLVESAGGGTLLLDEIGDVPLGVQARLLRVLEEHAVLPVGARRPRPVDVRFVAATCEDIDAAVGAGTFRRDLFYRLNALRIRVPPLRERRVEIPGLARAFAGAALRALGRNHEPVVTDAAMARLLAHHWPGNVRELRNVMERAVALAKSAAIEPEHLDLTPVEGAAPEPSASRSPAGPPSPPPAPGSGATMRAQVAALEQARILEALASCGGNQSRAARALGISRTTLLSRLDAYGVPRPRK